MSNGSPAPVPPPPAKKKSGILLWILGGCGVIVVLGILVVLLLGFWAKRKLESAQRNPAVAAAELMVRANPDLQLVSSDYDRGTITIRNTKTGEELTIDAREASEGRFRFRDGQGQEVKIDAQGEAGKLTVSSKEGEATFGRGTQVDAPSWVPAYPGASSEGLSSIKTAKGSTGSLMQKTADDPAQVLDFFESRLKSVGFQVSTNRATVDGKVSGMISGKSRTQPHTITVIVAADQGQTTVNVTYQVGD